jgi:hypothetical protein
LLAAASVVRPSGAALFGVVRFPRPKQALEKEKPLTNQRLFGILVEANGKISLRDFP